MKKLRTVLPWTMLATALVLNLFWSCSDGASTPTAPAAPSPSPAPASGTTQGQPQQQEPVAEPSVDIEKSTNGVDADGPPGPTIPVGEPVEWTYRVTNNGDTEIGEIAVTDDQLGPISCPQTTLAVGEFMTCTASGLAATGQYENLGTVQAVGPAGEALADEDPSHYFGGGSSFAAIDVEKATNGDDADFPRGPILVLGSAVSWTYEVTNIGQVDLTDVTVTDDQGVAVSCPASALDVGESMTCSASGSAIAGQYVNEARAEALDPEGNTVSDTDMSHYFGSDPAVAIEKLTEGDDADTAPGPTLFEGCDVSWSYEVTNTGNIELDNLVVTDDQGVAVSCPGSTLDVGETVVCTASDVVILGPYENEGEATAVDPLGTQVSAVDLSHYFGETVEPDCAVALPSTEILWPPNHKFAEIEVLGVVDSCGLPLAITIDSILQDEPTNGLGDGDTSPDGRGIGTATAEVRAERSGTGNGRVYHIGFTADDGSGASCTGEVVVGVPHDKKDTPIDDGPTYDSTLP
jgi:hypothetical protein